MYQCHSASTLTVTNAVVDVERQHFSDYADILFHTIKLYAHYIQAFLTL